MGTRLVQKCREVNGSHLNFTVFVVYTYKQSGGLSVALCSAKYCLLWFLVISDQNGIKILLDEESDIKSNYLYPV